MLKMIVCVGPNNLIGDKTPEGNGLLWHSKEELQFFKEKTLGQHLIFGENTAKFVPIELMKKDRKVTVLTYGTDIDSILEYDEQQNIDTFICGGYSVYKYFLENYDIDEIYFSILKEHIGIKEYKNPLYFPNLEELGYSIIEYSNHNDFINFIYAKRKEDKIWT